MKNILLVCSSGMSTNMLVLRMKKFAKSINFDANIWHAGDATLKEEVVKADIILLAPQVRYLLNKLNKMVNNQKPILLIDLNDYSSMNCKKILQGCLSY